MSYRKCHKHFLGALSFQWQPRTGSNSSLCVSPPFPLSGYVVEAISGRTKLSNYTKASFYSLLFISMSVYSDMDVMKRPVAYRFGHQS